MKRVTASRSSAHDAPKFMLVDLRRARLKVAGKNVGRAEFTAAVHEKLGKQRVTIMLEPRCAK
jgi:hypothetical protein